ncbi:DNA repair protein RecN [Halocola ammonii]
MLRQLSIQNYALIENIEVELSNGLSVITGETGSGKSIILGALGLIIGERADTKTLRNPEVKCIVEAHFAIGEFNLRKFFEENDLDFDEETVVRREISPSGKSRAFINDTPVRLNELKAFGKQLIDIHSQHQNSLLYDRSFQLSIVDAFAQNDTVLKEYSIKFSSFRKLKSRLKDLEEKQAQSAQDEDYLNFQLEELDEANLDNLNLEEIEEELQTLNHAEDIKSSLARAFSKLDEDDFSVVVNLKDASNAIGEISHLSKNYQSLSERLKSALIEVQDIASEIEQTADQVEFDPERISLLTDQVNKIHSLEQKHRVSGVQELIETRESIREKLDNTANLEGDIETTKKELANAERELARVAKDLSERRKKQLPKVKKEVEEILSFVGMPHAELNPEIRESENYDALGKDHIDFLIKTNKGHQAQTIDKIASGGETSRVMLALKASISRHKALPVLILDEIDSGVSGEVASKMGEVMKEMSNNMQLITITHLPQIAGKGNHHFKVYKLTDSNSTSTYLTPLTGNDRVKEIAQMLSGEKTTEAAMNNARELMGEI